jgi:prepilin-type N-terminal cleavage/methylation domain-containing protein
MISEKGFTLIEIIITIVLLAIAATFMMTIFGKQFAGSALTAGQVQSQYQLIQQMETITSNYRRELDAGTLAANWATFKASCSGKCACTATMSISTYNTISEHLQVLCRDGDQTLFAIFTQ